MPRHAPSIELPPYAYVPGHAVPHPVNDPAGHLHAARASAPEPPISAATLAALPSEPAARRRALAAVLGANVDWLFAIDLYNEGFCWEAHEAWEAFWHALGRTTPEARFVQGLIHLAAAGVKIREGKPAGVARHSRRARELLGMPRGRSAALEGAGVVPGGEEPAGPRDDGGDTLGLAPQSIAAVLAELEAYRQECWHTARCRVVRVLAESLRPVSPRPV